MGGLRLGFRDGNRNVPVLHSTRVIALNVDGTGLCFAAIEGAAGDAGNLLFGDGVDAIADDRDGAADEGDVVTLPLARAR